MKSMIKLMLVLAVAFACTFLLLNLTGVISLEKIEGWLNAAQSAAAFLVGGVIALLLFADLFVAMPTLTLMILSGFFLGPVVGAAYSLAGLTLAGLCGYALSYRYGDALIRFLIKDEKDRDSAVLSFRKYGIATILMSRAVPILPEVSACMAGLTRMHFWRFAAAWLFSTAPYAIIASYSGSKSTLSNPTPAILTASGLTLSFWLAWFLFRLRVRDKEARAAGKAVNVEGSQSTDTV
ncbi:MAG: VTT domain-containing protein [Pseudomonadota bacterium]